MSTPAPIQIGSFVTPIGEIFARRQSGDFQTIREGERYEVESIGVGCIILRSESREQFLCQIADVRAW
jgi:hypothetical protein